MPASSITVGVSPYVPITALRSKTFITDAAPGQEPITAVSDCQRVVLREKPPAGIIPYVGGTAGYQIFGLKPDGTPDAAPHTRYAGEQSYFETTGLFKAGQTIGFISALSGSMTMEQIEGIRT